jgi:ribosome biogenesis GTPase
MDIHELGWDSFFEESFRRYLTKSEVPARIVCEHKSRYVVRGEFGELSAQITGKLLAEGQSISVNPAVGDWVLVETIDQSSRAVIRSVLPRKTQIAREAVKPGGANSRSEVTDRQVLAANVDYAFVVSGLDQDHNLRRIERYLTCAWDSGATPVVLLNKSDVCNDLQIAISETESIAIGVPVHAVSARTGDGIAAVQSYAGKGMTCVLLGSSGVGKSSIINCLCGHDIQRTTEVRESDNRGRHTTTTRDLIILPNGGIVIDTPGLRSLGIWSDESSLDRTFPDIEELARGCRFRDCSHESEPGCEVLRAVENGSLDSNRLESYKRLLKEIERVRLQSNERVRRQRERATGKYYRSVAREKKKLKRRGLI